MKSTFFEIFGDCKNPPRKARRSPRNTLRPHYFYRFKDDETFDRETSPSLSGAPNFLRMPFIASLNPISQQAGRPLTELEADFIWIAVAVYLADRCSPRHPFGRSGASHWRRRIHVEVPVRSLESWHRCQAELDQVLEFLTEDDWTLNFVPTREEFGAEQQRHLLDSTESKSGWTSLFSGGLDSLAGALQFLAESDCPSQLISGQTHNRIAFQQNAQVAKLRELFPRRIEHIGVFYGFPDKNSKAITGFESSQRTRAFVHTSIGIVTALTAQQSRLYLFENGFGALNLPCDSTQSGSQNSRGTHPVFLGRMAQYASAFFKAPFSIINPFIAATKAQMLMQLKGRGYEELLQESFSCDIFPNYHHRQNQCGHCPSCLIRRLAFHAADFPDHPSNYSTNVLEPGRTLRASEQLALLKLSVQADSIRNCLNSADPWTALCSTWPDLFRTESALQSPFFRDAVLKLLKRHLDEWNCFPASLATPASLSSAA